MVWVRPLGAGAVNVANNRKDLEQLAAVVFRRVQKAELIVAKPILTVLIRMFLEVQHGLSPCGYFRASYSIPSTGPNFSTTFPAYCSTETL